MKTQTKERPVVLPLEIKALADDGTFTGVANMMEIVDLVDDLVHAGAFTKTLAEQGASRPLLADHKADMAHRIGAVELRENGNALEVTKGEFNLAKDSGRQAYEDVKFYTERGIPMGLSIGYRIPAGKSYIESGVRHIKELILDEVSVVPWPANQQSYIAAVKSREACRGKSATYEAFWTKATKGWEWAPDDMETVLARWAMWDAWDYFGDLKSALQYVLEDLLYTDQLTNAEKAQRAEEAISYFHNAASVWFADMLQRMTTKALPTAAELQAQRASALEVKERRDAHPAGEKAGRVFSAANETALRGIREGLASHLDSIDTLLSALDSDEEKNLPPSGGGDHKNAPSILAGGALDTEPEPGTSPTPEETRAAEDGPDWGQIKTALGQVSSTVEGAVVLERLRTFGKSLATKQ